VGPPNDTMTDPVAPTLRVFWSASHLGHDPAVEVEAGFRNPMQETPARIEAILTALRRDLRCTIVEPRAFGRAPIDQVHDPAMIDYLEGAFAEWSAAAGHDIAIPDVFLHPGLRAGMGPLEAAAAPLGRLGFWCFETTTPLVAGTYAAARGAIDCALAATELVLHGGPTAYAVCRPPGHHAATAVFGGYCFLNNAAVAARWAIANGAARVAVLDVDYHHGNGTQQIFYADPSVLYASLHGDPARAYPYFAGFADETGAGKGSGTNVNVPLPIGCDDETYLGHVDRLLDTICTFGADLLIVSLGLDLFSGDPLGDLAVTTAGIAAIGAHIGAAGIPTAIVQEGGYAVDDLGANALAFVDGLLSLSGTRPRTTR